MIKTLAIGLLTVMAAETAEAQRSFIDFQVIHLGRHPVCSDATYTVFRTQGDWLACSEKSRNEPAQTASMPPIDFERYTLLVASTGVKPSSGYEMIFVSIKDAVPQGAATQRILVNVLELSPGTCPQMEMLMSSTSYALIPKTTKRIVFVTSKADRDCHNPARANEER